MIGHPKPGEFNQRWRKAPDTGTAASAVLDTVRGLVLGPDVRDAVLRHLSAARPHEGVGLLATRLEDRPPSNEDVVSPSPPAPSCQRQRALVAATSPATGNEPVVRAMRFFPGRNVDDSPTRFTMDPAEVLEALRQIDAAGWWLGAIVHSHPCGPAHPSATDLREAYYPDALMVIVSLAERRPRPRAWRLVPGPGGETSTIEVPVWVDGEPAAGA